MRLRSTFLLASLLLVPASARADAQDHAAAAQVLFEQGKSLVEAGRFAEACPKLAESLRLDPGLGTMLWLADCYENNGQTASAWAQFKDAAAKAAFTRDAREKIARDRATKLEPRLARLQVTVAKGGDVSGLAVTRDGIALGRAEIGLPVPVDPGTHTIGASAPGKKPWSTTVTIPTTATTTPVTIPPLEANAESSAAAPITPPPSEAPPSNTQRVVGYVVGGLGLVSLGVGTFFSFKGKGAYDDSNANGHCVANRCDPTGVSLRDDAKSNALVATVTMGAGAVLLGAGVVLVLTAPKAKSIAISPGPGSLSVSGTF